MQREKSFKKLKKTKFILDCGGDGETVMVPMTNDRKQFVIFGR